MNTMAQPARRALDRFYWKLANLIIPGQVNAQRPYLTTLEGLIAQDTAWLDLGCGHRLVPSWLPGADDQQTRLIGRAGSVVGVDLDLCSLRQHRAIHDRVLAGVDQLPFADDSFDLITANMVVEHLDDPRTTLMQIARVLKPGGVLLFHTPNLNHPITRAATLFPQRIKNLIVKFLDGREGQDVFPTRYRMNTSGAIHRLAGDAGLMVCSINLLNSSAETLMLGPLVVAEMVFIRLSNQSTLSRLRSNIITTLQKPHTIAADPVAEVCPTRPAQAA